MTPSTADQPQMLVEDFEQMARTAPEGVKLEFIHGKLEVKPVPDAIHRAIVMWLLQRCMQQRPDLLLYPEQQLKIEHYRNGRAIADGALAPVDHFVRQAADSDWADPEGVLMTVEVTSHDWDTDRRDRVEKPNGYAQAGIPVYLLVDRESSMVTVHSEPEKGVYQSVNSSAYGKTVEIPAPVGITLETEKLKDYAG